MFDQGNFVLSGITFVLDCQAVFRLLRAAMKKEAGHEEHEGDTKSTKGDTKATKRNEKAAVPNPPSQKIGRGLDALPRVTRLAEDPSRGEGPPSQKIGRGLDALPRVTRLAEDPSRGEGPFAFEH